MTPEPRSALDEARDALMERERRREENRRSRGTAAGSQWDPRWVAIAVTSWGLTLWMLVAPAGPFRHPQPQPFSPPGALAESSLRFGIWLAAIRVEEFRSRMHRLPVDLEEAGMIDRTLTLTGGTDGSYRISAAGTSYSSDQNRDQFLGESLDRLTSGR